MYGPFLGGFDIKYVYLLEIHMDGPILGGFDIKFVYLLEFHMDGPILGGFDIKGCMFGGFSHTWPVFGRIILIKSMKINKRCVQSVTKSSHGRTNMLATSMKFIKKRYKCK